MTSSFFFNEIASCFTELFQNKPSLYNHYCRPIDTLSNFMSFRTTKRQNLNQFAGSVTKKQCFILMLTDGNVRDDVFFPEQIMHMSKSCRCAKEWDVYKWSDFIHGRQGKARVVIPSPLELLGY